MMKNRIKIVMVNEGFARPIFYRRWELFAERHPDVDVTLLAPYLDERKTNENSFGHNVTFKGEIVDKVNFHIELFNKKSLKLGWISPQFKEILLRIKPDIVYNIGAHNQLSLIQLIYLTKKYLPGSKVMSFSMRGPEFNLQHYKDTCKPISTYIKRRFVFYYYFKILLKYFNKNCDAVFCHYPDAMKCFMQEGYKGPIYMQTQVGVNYELFHEDLEARKEIRSKLQIDDDTYLFGSATRFTMRKGLDDIIKALPSNGKWKLLMMGSGSKENTDLLKKLIEERNLTDKVILPGFIPLNEMPKYWNAIDCMIHVPKTSFFWVETFSIALVQCMITKKPVIGSNSGSVPYQIGPDGIIVPEGDINAIHDKIEWVLNHQDEAKQIGEKMYERALNCFSVQHLNEVFYDTITQDVLQGKYDIAKSDMSTYKVGI